MKIGLNIYTQQLRKRFAFEKEVHEIAEEATDMIMSEFRCDEVNEEDCENDDGD